MRFTHRKSIKQNKIFLIEIFSAALSFCFGKPHGYVYKCIDGVSCILECAYRTFFTMQFSCFSVRRYAITYKCCVNDFNNKIHTQNPICFLVIVTVFAALATLFTHHLKSMKCLFESFFRNESMVYQRKCREKKNIDHVDDKRIHVKAVSIHQSNYSFYFVFFSPKNSQLFIHQIEVRECDSRKIQKVYRIKKSFQKIIQNHNKKLVVYVPKL